MDLAEGDVREALLRQLALWLSSGCPIPEDHSDFHIMIDAACAEGLAGVVLTALEVDHAPPWAVNRLRASASRAAAENMQAMAELSRIARAFECAGIPLMALKGASLSLTVYPRLDLRPMSDLDLLVRPGDALRAVRLLESIGYQKGAALLRDDFFPAHYYEQELILRGPQSVRIDLHAQPWRPMHLAQAVPAHALWADAVSLPLGDARIWIPSPESMMVHLAAHAAFHGCSRLIWLCDLERVAEKYAANLNWPLVAERARTWCVGLAVQKALDRAEEFFGEFRPPQVRREFDTIPATWRDRLTLWHTPKDASAPLLHVACNLACLRGLWPRIGYAYAMLFPGREHLAERYPFRHFGWVVLAHAQRAVRGMARAIFMPFESLRRTTSLGGLKGAT